uniref:Uncharacterized protein n=1 Tax=Rangifer tarandus platyrhynchus TaxID=3082113 RepID=A0ACB0F2L4_RANTA|nr:unnamed protein product [Rangifer tarandus platyrhynchus]
MTFNLNRCAPSKKSVYAPFISSQDREEKFPRLPADYPLYPMGQNCTTRHYLQQQERPESRKPQTRVHVREEPEMEKPAHNSQWKSHWSPIHLNYEAQALSITPAPAVILCYLETYIADENILLGPVNKDTIISTHKPKRMGYQQLEGKLFLKKIKGAPAGKGAVGGVATRRLACSACPFLLLGQPGPRSAFIAPPGTAGGGGGARSRGRGLAVEGAGQDEGVAC